MYKNIAFRFKNKTVIFTRNYKVLFIYVVGNALIIAFGLKYKVPDIRHNWHLFLDRPIYYPEIRKFGIFTVWTSKSVPGNTHISQQEMLQEAAKLKRENESLLLVLDKKLSNIDTSLNPKLLASYEDAIVDRENYFIYSID